MAEPRLMKVDALPLHEIEVGGRARPVDAGKVDAIASSLTELGVMMHPVQVAKVKKGGFRLVAGGHRIAAARQVGWDSVPVRAWADVTQQWLEIMELDENLSSAGMTALDTAVFLAKRKAIYEAQYPETKRGVAGGKVGKVTTDTMSVVTFAKVVASVRGVHERSIRRLIRAGEVLHPDEVTCLRSMAEPVKLADLETLSKIPERRERSGVVFALAHGKVKTASQAVKQRKAASGKGPASISKEDKLYMRLEDAWRNAPMVAKRRFVENYSAKLFSLLNDLDGTL